MAVAEPMSLSPPTPRKKKKKCTDTEAEKYTSKFQVNTHLSFLVFFFFSVDSMLGLIHTLIV